MGFTSRRPAWSGVLMMALAGSGLAGPARAQPVPAPRHPSSPYADGTGNSAVDTLNSGQLDRNYTGAWHQVPPRRAVGGPIGLDDRPELRPVAPGPASATTGTVPGISPHS